jgi:hypothetical protein
VGWAAGSRVKNSLPIVIGEIDHDRLRGASHNDPDEAVIFRRIDFHVRQPRRNVDKVAGVRGRGKLAALSPTDRAIALEHVGDRLLLAVMMDAGLGPGLDDKYSAPKRGVDAIVSRDGGTTLGTRRLRRSAVELVGPDDANGEYLLITKPSLAKRPAFQA